MSLMIIHVPDVSVTYEYVYFLMFFIFVLKVTMNFICFLHSFIIFLSKAILHFYSFYHFTRLKLKLP